MDNQKEFTVSSAITREQNKILEIAKNTTVQLDKQGKLVVGLTDQYGELSKEQENLLKLLLTQSNIIKDINNVTQDEQKRILNVLEVNKQLSYQYGTQEQLRGAQLENLRVSAELHEKELDLSLQIANAQDAAAKAKEANDEKSHQEELQRVDELSKAWGNLHQEIEDRQRAADLMRNNYWMTEKEAVEEIANQRKKSESDIYKAARDREKYEKDKRKRDREALIEDLKWQKDHGVITPEGQKQLAAAEKEEREEARDEKKQKAKDNFGIQKDYNFGDAMLAQLGDAIKSMGKQLESVVDNASNLVTSWQTKMTYRLEGSSLTGQSIFSDVQRAVGVSGLVQQQKVIEKIGQAIDQGIAYNVEQRAFLATVSENIQSTFNAFDSNLMKIIRIQQADSTIARMGMEKALNDILTNMYKDSSYLNDMYDSVSSALFEMTASQGREQAVETEYVVQKWLGSLYSLGASSNAIQQIATGLGYLGSGNVQALSGNSNLQTLLAMSASRAGLDYAQLLTGGLNARDTNELLKSMVEYLAEIADSTSENKVVRSAYGNVFGLSLSDIKGFSNLASSIPTIYSDNLSYSQAQGVTSNALANLSVYTPIQAQMNTFLQNALLGTGMTYANSPIGYLMYKSVDLVDKMTGGGPNIDLSYWGLGTDFKIPSLIKSGMFGLGLIGSILSGLGGLFGGANGILGSFGYEDVNTRGTGFSLRTTSGTSLSTTLGNAASSDVEQQSLKEGTEKSENVEGASGKGNKKDVDDLYEALVRPSEKYQVSDIRLNTEELNSGFKKAMAVASTLLDINSRNAINVNLSKINGQQISEANGLPVNADQTMKQFLLAVASFIKYGNVSSMFKGLGVNIQNQADDEEYTLQDLIDVFVPMLQGETGVPVKIEAVDSMTNLMQDLMQR